MAPQAPELEQRLSELQTQLDQISVSLTQWRAMQDRLEPTEHRLSALTERGAEILDAWTAISQRHAQAVGEIEARLTSWHDADNRLEQDAARRVQEIGRIIENEWRSLRQIHQEPVRELQDQAASLTEVSLAAASAAQTSFDRAETRLAALEATIHGHMAELSRDVRTALAALQTPAAAATATDLTTTAATPEWPLDGVMRLHQQLRQSGPAGDAAHAAATLVPALALEPPPALLQRMESLERTLEDERGALKEAAARSDRTRRTGQAAVLLLVVGFAAAGGFAWWIQQQARAATARAAAAERQSQLAVDEANTRIATARDEAASQVAAARDAAAKAQVVSDVLAAPDLVRLILVGNQGDARFSGQLLWSRSRGLVFTSSRLPKPQAGVYQLWLLTQADPVSVGTFSPDSAGRATIASSTPPTPAGPVTGASVTLEPLGGSPSPSDPPILARAPAP